MAEQDAFYSTNFRRVQQGLRSLPQTEQALLTSFMTLLDYKEFLYDPSLNLARDLNVSAINDFILDFNQVNKSLNEYSGPNRVGIREAKDLVEGALRELYAAHSASTNDHESEKVSALMSCRGKINDAYLQLEHLKERVAELYTRENEPASRPPSEMPRQDLRQEPSWGNSKTEAPINEVPVRKTSEGDVNQSPPPVPNTSTDSSLVPESTHAAKYSHLTIAGSTRIGVYFGGEPATLIPWDLVIDALVLHTGTSGSLTGKMAEGFLDALGQQSQSFRRHLKTALSARQIAGILPEASRYIEPETPLFLDTQGQYPSVKPRYIITATAYRRAGAQARVESKQPKSENDESQDTLEVINAGDAAEAVIRLAAEKQIARIAIPLLGTGIAGLSSTEVAREMLAAICTTTASTSIEQVILLIRDWEAYRHLLSLVEHKPQKSFNDQNEGEDYLKVKAEMDALADTLLLAETGTPLAVGILGGWGSGKSFAMRMLHERMAEIRAMAVSAEYVGHPYLIDFDAWTYTKSNLWSSLMQTIFLELNRQMEREKEFAPGCDGAKLEDVRNIYPGTRGQSASDKAANEVLWQQLQKNSSPEREQLEKQEKLLTEKRIELETKQREVAKEVDDAIERNIDEVIWKPLLDVLSKPFGRSWQYHLDTLFGVKVDNEEKDPQIFRTWVEFCIFALLSIVAILVPALLQNFQEFKYPSILLAIGSLVTGIIRVYNQLKTKVEKARTEIRESRDEKFKEKLEEQKAAFTKIETDIKTLEVKVSIARRLAGVTATFDSLLELCQERLRQSDYENELGLMHRVKLDLDEMDWALRRPPKKAVDNQPLSFPRGNPRIILFIDDLDRCPPQRVVEVLEATQLLLKTELFVVVLAMDVRYVTRALEKAYQGILDRQGDPSGLDYIEKIIQIPYQVRPVDPQVVGNYISSMMTVQVDNIPSQSSTKTVGRVTAELENVEIKATGFVTETGTQLKPDQVRKPRTLSTFSQVVAFSKDEHDFLVMCCQQVNLTPRAIKRLVNVYKLLKILWSREPRWPQPESSVEQAIVLLVTLSCSYPDAMREAFNNLDTEIRSAGVTSSRNFSEFFAAESSDNISKLSKQEWQKLQRDLQNLWSYESVNALKNLPLANMRDVLPLVRSFSFVSDLGF